MGGALLAVEQRVCWTIIHRDTPANRERRFRQQSLGCLRSFARQRNQLCSILHRHLQMPEPSASAPT
jgi:hypothetical protein